MNGLTQMLADHPLLALVVIVVLGFVALRVAVRLACLGVVAVIVLLIVATLLGGS